MGRYIFYIYSMFICLDCGYIIGKINHKKEKEND